MQVLRLKAADLQQSECQVDPGEGAFLVVGGNRCHGWGPQFWEEGGISTDFAEFQTLHTNSEGYRKLFLNIGAACNI